METKDPIKIQFYPPIKLEKLRTGLKSFITKPPSGYFFIESERSFKDELVDYLKNFKYANNLYSFFIKTFKSVKISEIVHKTGNVEGASLIFSRGILYYGNKTWVLFILDTPYSLAGNNYDTFMKNKDKIENILGKDNCKAIICANESTLSLIKNIFKQSVADKSVVVRPSLDDAVNFSINKEKYKKNKKIQLLFIGSINNPEDFYIKGGLESIRVLENLKDKYNINLIIRCKLPDELREKVKNNKDIKLIEDHLSYDDLIKLYTDSDILLFPSHIYVLMVSLEAMHFGIPIVCLDTYAVKDYIINGYNGIIVKKSEKIKEYYKESYPLNIRDKRFIDEIKNVDVEVIDRLSQKVEDLINNPKLRKKLGENGMKMARTKFSMETRNKALKKIFDKALVN